MTVAEQIAAYRTDAAYWRIRVILADTAESAAEYAGYVAAAEHAAAELEAAYY